MKKVVYLWITVGVFALSSCNSNDDAGVASIEIPGVTIDGDVDCCSAEEALQVYKFLQTVRILPELSTVIDGKYNEMRESGEHIRNEEFRASERSKGNYHKVGQGDSEERPRRDDKRRRDDRGLRRDDDRRGRRPDAGPRDEAPISDQERQRRAAVSRDRRMMSDVDNRDKAGRYDNDFDQEFRHSAMFAKRILRDRKPTLGADKEVPIIHGRRKSWKRRDLDENTDNND